MKFRQPVIFFVVALAVACFADTKGRIVGAVDSKNPFDGGRLFTVLDSVGGGGTWMEWDVNGVKDPSLMSVLDPMLKSKNVPEMVWVLVERAKPLVSVLMQKGRGEVIVFYEIDKLDATPVPLEINPVLNPNVVFRDYEQLSETEFVHKDKNNLKVQIFSDGFKFTYTHKSETPLELESDFKSKTFVEKENIIRMYRDYFMYEYSLMLRAFVQSVRGVFNWQPWHWYMDDWKKKSFIGRGEIEAILMRGMLNETTTLFDARTIRGETICFNIHANGFSELVVTRVK